MSLDTFLAIVCLVGAAVCYGIYRYCDENVRLTYHDQRVGPKITKKEEKQ